MCDWLGNSESIARKHYYQTTDEHFSRAATADQNPKQALTKPPTLNPEPTKEIGRFQAKQNPKQLVAA